jgi:hypothetical protein
MIYSLLVYLLPGTGGIVGEGHDLTNITLFGKQAHLVTAALHAAPSMGIIVVMLTGNSLNITGIVADRRVEAVSVAVMETSGENLNSKLNDVGRVHIHAPISALKLILIL